MYFCFIKQLRPRCSLLETFSTSATVASTKLFALIFEILFQELDPPVVVPSICRAGCLLSILTAKLGSGILNSSFQQLHLCHEKCSQKNIKELSQHLVLFTLNAKTRREISLQKLEVIE